MQNEKNALHQRDLDYALDVERLNEITVLRRQLINAKDETGVVKDETAFAARKLLQSIRSLGNGMCLKITNIANDARRHTNLVLRGQGAPPETHCEMLSHVDIDMHTDF